MMLDGEAQRRADRRRRHRFDEAARILAEDSRRIALKDEEERRYAVPVGVSPLALLTMLRYGTRSRTIVMDGRRRRLGIRCEHARPDGGPSTLTYPLKPTESWEDGLRRLGIL